MVEHGLEMAPAGWIVVGQFEIAQGIGQTGLLLAQAARDHPAPQLRAFDDIEHAPARGIVAGGGRCDGSAWLLAERAQMSPFVWEGTDKRGVKMKGEQTARNANLLRAELRRQGINPTVVKVKPKPLFGAAGKKVTAKDISFFSRQMATMMKSGVPIVGALEIIGSYVNARREPASQTLNQSPAGTPRY
ncbi:hypothetical protein QUF31_21400 [Dickeya chrysanthemi]|nr:hypothetical protein [Dickeya chrysanthemi]WJM85517.1 hypothetical protein QUF31_21400 [Dickeya chrysanthemi]